MDARATATGTTLLLMNARIQRFIVAVFALLPLAAHAQSAAGELATDSVLAASGGIATLVDLLPFVIAAAGIAGLLLIRRQTHYL